MINLYKNVRRYFIRFGILFSVLISFLIVPVAFANPTLSQNLIQLPATPNAYSISITCDNPTVDVYGVYYQASALTGGGGGPVTLVANYQPCTSTSLQANIPVASTTVYGVIECVSGFQNNTTGACSLEDASTAFASYPVSGSSTSTCATSSLNISYASANNLGYLIVLPFTVILMFLAVLVIIRFIIWTLL